MIPATAPVLNILSASWCFTMEKFNSRGMGGVYYMGGVALCVFLFDSYEDCVGILKAIAFFSRSSRDQDYVCFGGDPRFFQQFPHEGCGVSEGSL